MPQKQAPDTLPFDSDQLEDANSSHAQPVAQGASSGGFSLGENIGPKGAFNFAKGAAKSIAGIGKGLLTSPGETISNLTGISSMKDLLPSYRTVSGIPIPVPNAEGLHRQTDQLNQIGTGLIQHPAETLGQIGGPALLTAGILKAPEMMKSAKASLYPQSISFTPNEVSANAMGKSLGLPEDQMASFRQSAAEELPTIKHHIDTNQLKIGGTGDLAKAAKATFQPVRDFWTQKMLLPSSESVGKISLKGIPTELGEGEGKYASLQDLDERISTINKELKREVDARKAGKTVKPSDEDLEGERRALTNILYENVGKATGNTPEAVKAFRERYGRLGDISTATERGLNRDLVKEGAAIRGGSVPAMSNPGIMTRAANLVLGGPEIRGNRAVIRALSKVQGRETPFPTIAPPEVNSPTRLSLWNGIEPERPAGPILLSPTEELQNRSARLASRKSDLDVERGRQQENLASHGNNASTALMTAPERESALPLENAESRTSRLQQKRQALLEQEEKKSAKMRSNLASHGRNK